MFIPLRLHSYFSFLESLASPSDLVRAAQQHRFPAIGLTDHRWLSGAIEFYLACKQGGVKPIIGLELDVAPPASLPAAKGGKLVFLATNRKGWSSLCHLSSRHLAESGNPPASTPFEHIRQEAEGLICLTGGWDGLAARLSIESADFAIQTLRMLQEAFPGKIYVELQRHAPQDYARSLQMAILAQKTNLPILATHSVYYLTEEQARLQRVLAGIRLNTPFEAAPADAAAPQQAHFLSPEEMHTKFKDLPEALERTMEVEQLCQLDLPLGENHFPRLDTPPGVTPIQLLRDKALEGARRLYGIAGEPTVGVVSEIPPAVQKRLDHELEVIDSLGYASLFLIMEDILGYARKSGVPIASCGSASSSLVAHCLGVTSPDPLRLNLYFERFLNPARLTPPDIDTDLCSRRRDGVIEYVYRRFGKERVAMVSTISRFRHRSSLRETAKTYGLPSAEINRLLEGLPYRWYGPPDEEKEGSPFDELTKRYPSPTYQAIFRDAEALIGVPDHLSIHPGGVVIAPERITDLSPTQLAAKGVVITQFDLDSIGSLGLVKIDLLGIRGLTVLGDVAETVRAEHPERFARPLEALEGIPESDPDTSAILRIGKTIGCFQIESPGMRATLKEIQASSQDDLMVALALYRPGPLGGGLKDAFVRRHKRLEAPSHLHPSLAPLLEETYGVILYQEQVLRIAHELAGLSLADADLLRRAMSHFDPGKHMQTLKEKFIEGAQKRNGVPPAVSERIWELMAAFAGYGFPKAHAASYAQVAWRSAWCKVHYPAIFMAAVLANWGGYYPQRVYLSEARRLGLQVKPPDVNYAKREFSTIYLDDRYVLFMGLDQVKELTRRTIERILQRRLFHSFDDFLARADPRPVEAENLVKAGALEAFGHLPALLDRLRQGSWGKGQLPLFATGYFEGQDISPTEKAANQEEVLGTGLAIHPLEIAAQAISQHGALTTVEAIASLGQRVRVAGMRQIWRRTSTSSGDYIYFMALEDLEGLLDVVISGEVYRRNRNELSNAGPYIIEGVIEMERNRSEPTLRAERIWNIKE